MREQSEWAYIILFNLLIRKSAEDHLWLALMDRCLFRSSILFS